MIYKYGSSFQKKFASRSSDIIDIVYKRKIITLSVEVIFTEEPTFCSMHSNKSVVNICKKEPRNYIANNKIWPEKQARESKRSTLCRKLVAESNVQVQDENEK